MQKVSSLNHQRNTKCSNSYAGDAAGGFPQGTTSVEGLHLSCIAKPKTL